RVATRRGPSRGGRLRRLLQGGEARDAAHLNDAGLTHGGFYRHFTGKDELYAAAVRQFLCQKTPAAWQKPRQPSAATHRATSASARSRGRGSSKWSSKTLTICSTTS